VASTHIRITPEFSQAEAQGRAGRVIHMRPRHPQTADIAVAVRAVDGQAEIVTSGVRRMPGAANAMVILAAVVSLSIGDAIAAAGAMPQVGSGVTRAPLGTLAAPAFVWPLAGEPVVVRAFDPPAEPWLPGHRGVDLAGTLGQRVYAAGTGTVSFSGRVAGIGVVSITHPDGLRTTYEPVTASVHVGNPITIGTPIGTIDGRLPHCAPGPAACLHWGLIRAGMYLDPLMLLGLGQVRLYPSP
jgi:murein DD-endopeptidase MepM/ murein hydrolase activator NlpD